jgi:hypothetical protein
MTLKDLETKINSYQSALDNIVMANPIVNFVNSQDIRDIPIQTLRDYAAKYGCSLPPVTEAGYVRLDLFKNGKTLIKLESKRMRVVIEEEN